MQVKQLLDLCDKKKVMNQVFELYYKDTDLNRYGWIEKFIPRFISNIILKKYVYKSYGQVYDTLKSLAPIKKDNERYVLLNTIYIEDDNFIYNEMSCYNIDEIINNFKEIDEIEKIDIEKVTTVDQMKYYCNLVDITSYGYELTPWEEILGYEIFEDDLTICNENEMIANILYEITFFGYDQKTIQNFSNSLKKEIDEVEEILKLPKEEQDQYFKDIDEVEKEWKVDDIMEEEKNDELLNDWYSSLKMKLNEYYQLKFYKESILK